MNHEHQSFVRDVAFDSVEFVCSNCASVGTDVVDYETGDRVCCACGLCDSSFLLLVPEFNQLGDSWTRFQRRPSVYKRKFHLNEQIAQYLCTGPSAPAHVVYYVAQSGVRAGFTTAREFTARFIKSCCGALAACKKYAERWIDIRRQVLRQLSIPNDQRFPPWRDMQRMRADFERASDCFDRILYKSGRRRTQHDIHHGRPASAPGRHNFPNYSCVS